MQKLVALIVVVAVTFSLQSPVNPEKQSQLKYLIPLFTANWYKSVEYCNALGRRLAIIDSKEKEASLYQAVIASTINNTGSNLVWVGASDLADEGSFHWHGTGQRVVYSNWASSQPDNGYRTEHCVEAGLLEYPALSMKWQWNDRDCKVERYFACEIH